MSRRSDSMKCPNPACEIEISYSSKFCPQCGTRVGPPDTTPVSTGTSTGDTRNTSQQGRTSVGSIHGNVEKEGIGNTSKARRRANVAALLKIVLGREPLHSEARSMLKAVSRRLNNLEKLEKFIEEAEKTGDLEKAMELFTDMEYFVPDPETMKRRIEAIVPRVFTNTFGMTFVLIEPGTFVMGSPKNEERRGGDEEQHQVMLTKPYYLQTTQVTQGQWKKLMGNNPSYYKGCSDDCPVESVSWHDIQAFINKLNEKEETNKYRLPTEAEWEYACRAGSMTAYHFGDYEDNFEDYARQAESMAAYYFGYYEDDLEDYAWYGDNSNNKTHPVSLKKPNAWGLYDMHGNVWEWCEDHYGSYPANSVTDPIGPSSGKYRVLRGGSCGNYAWFLRSASRRWDTPDRRYNSFGFRVARAS
jgi:formylglycine-generating enzyme required for sulfatase activity